MEQHQVPRNISGFQFHLIGDMTLRQFLYVASGGALAYFIFRFAPFPSIINLSIAGLVGFVGFAFAFLPIQERPLDKWIVAFVKSIYSPTQYLWQKEGNMPDILLKQATIHVKPASKNQIENHKYAKEKLRSYLATLPSTPHETLNERERKYVEKTLSLFKNEFVLPSVPSSTQSSYVSLPALSKMNQNLPISSSSQANSNANPALQKDFANLAHAKVTTTPPQDRIISYPAPPPPHSIPSEVKPAREIPTIINNFGRTPEIVPNQQINDSYKEQEAMQKKLSEMTSEKDALLKQLDNLKRELETAEKPNIIRPSNSTETRREPTIKTITGKAEIINELGLPNLPQTPNLIIGVIKDSQKKFLPNIIITVKDNKGMPLRAFKTNKLGQFASATPLSNGTFNLEIEDPLKRYIFDIAQITLSGKIFLPIEIIAKGEREILREKLSKEIFGNPNI